MGFKQIEITDIEGFKIGNSEDKEGATGVTVIVAPSGAVAGVSVMGGGPATRETDLLKSENTVEQIHSVVLSGGSAFGLESSSGVMEELENLNIGFKMGDVSVPIVCQASIFDLFVGDKNIRANKKMGAEAIKNAIEGNEFLKGNYGAGTGASVGKLFNMDRAMKTGLGTCACTNGIVSVGAITVVNAFADIYDGGNNIIAGLLNKDKNRIEGTISHLKDFVSVNSFSYTKTDSDEKSDISNDNIHINSSLPANEMGYDISFNTTISCLITNAKLTKSQANKLAGILHDGYARAIKPVHSSLDGDTIFVMSTCETDINFDAFAALATDMIQYSVIDGALSAESEYGLPCAKDFKNR